MTSSRWSESAAESEGAADAMSLEGVVRGWMGQPAAPAEQQKVSKGRKKRAAGDEAS
jgi:hypothetical protein